MAQSFEVFTRSMLEERIRFIRRMGDIRSWMVVVKVAQRTIELLECAQHIEGFGGGREFAFYVSCLHSIKTFAQQRKKEQVLYICWGMWCKLNRGDTCFKRRMQLDVLGRGERDIGTLAELPEDVLGLIARHI